MSSSSAEKNNILSQIKNVQITGWNPWNRNNYDKEWELKVGKTRENDGILARTIYCNVESKLDLGNETTTNNQKLRIWEDIQEDNEFISCQKNIYSEWYLKSDEYLI